MMYSWWTTWYNHDRTAAADGGTSDDVQLVDDIEDDDEDDEQKMSVPLTVTIGMLAGFIFMGALLFGVLEEWDWLTSAYCCFVTISTIGFGDVVPGSQNFDTVVGQLKMLVAAIYMVFGMALLSMAFNLIQEEMVGKFKWLGMKLGIVKKDDDDYDDDDGGALRADTPGGGGAAPARPPAVAPAPQYFGQPYDKNK